MALLGKQSGWKHADVWQGFVATVIQPVTYGVGLTLDSNFRLNRLDQWRMEKWWSPSERQFLVDACAGFGSDRTVELFLSLRAYCGLGSDIRAC